MTCLAVSVLLLTPLPAAPAMTTSLLSRYGDAPAVVALSEPPAASLRPDEHSRIDVPAYLAAQEERSDAEPVSNPFRRRFHPPGPGRDETLALSAILRSAAGLPNACVVNQTVLGCGEFVAGLLIEGIDTDGVELRGAHFSLYLPLQDEAVSVRLPQ